MKNTRHTAPTATRATVTILLYFGLSPKSKMISRTAHNREKISADRITTSTRMATTLNRTSIATLLQDSSPACMPGKAAEPYSGYQPLKKRRLPVFSTLSAPVPSLSENQQQPHTGNNRHVCLRLKRQAPPVSYLRQMSVPGSGIFRGRPPGNVRRHRKGLP
jgi:hypothetical protein